MASLTDSSKPDAARTDNQVDAAVAVVAQGMQIDSNSLWPNDKLAGTVDPAQSAPDGVFKMGRTTCRTTGTISAIGMFVKVFILGMYYFFDGQVEISGDTGLFADEGDSGSLVINKQFQAFGLLMGGSKTGGNFGFGVAYANPLPQVLNTFAMDLVP